MILPLFTAIGTVQQRMAIAGFTPYSPRNSEYQNLFPEKLRALKTALQTDFQLDLSLANTPVKNMSLVDVGGGTGILFDAWLPEATLSWSGSQSISANTLTSLPTSGASLVADGFYVLTTSATFAVVDTYGPLTVLDLYLAGTGFSGATIIVKLYDQSGTREIATGLTYKINHNSPAGFLHFRLGPDTDYGLLGQDANETLSLKILTDTAFTLTAYHLRAVGL